MSCPTCYENGTKCPKAGDNTLLCQACCDNPLGERLPGGTYSAALSRASSVLTGISPPLVDAVLQFKGPAAVVSALTAEEATLLASKGNDPIYDDYFGVW